MLNWIFDFIGKILKIIIKLFEKIILPILKLLFVIGIIFCIPFILPVIGKLLINAGFFSDFSEFEKIGNFFNNWYSLSYIGLGIFLLFFSFNKFEGIKTFFGSRDWLINLREMIISSSKSNNEVLKKADEQKAFITKIDKDSKKIESNVAQHEMQLKLGLSENKAISNCSDCNRVDLERENLKLREFATYRVLNQDAKSLLHIIYNENFIETDKFKNKIIKGYNRKYRNNKKMPQNVANKLANKKYENMLDGLKFLNIIEPSEDDKILKLTTEGKTYVEKYIENKEDDEK